MKSVLFVALIANVLTPLLGSYSIPYVTPKYCGADQYFDPVCLRCRHCGDSRQEALRQRPSEGGSSCMCKPEYYLKDRKGPYDIVCESCPGNQVPSTYGYGCIKCNEYDSSNDTSKCQSCINGIIVEDGEEQLCIPCIGKTVPQYQVSSCVSCSHEHVYSEGRCTCLSNLTFSGGHCLPLVRSNLSLFTVKFENGVNVRSLFFVEHFNAAFHNCKEHGNKTACFVLLNMCVMLMYRVENRLFSTEDNICSEFMSLKLQDTQCGDKGKVFGFWLFYRNDVQSELYKTDVPTLFSSNPKLPSSKLQIVAVKYGLDGTFHSMSVIKSHDLQLCTKSSRVDDTAFVFGTTTKSKCEISVQELWDSSEILFIELYLASDIRSNSSTMYPIPVLIKNIQVNGEYVNQGNDMSKWQLVRRFFLTDSLSGIDAGANLPANHHKALAKVFRFASEITLKIILKNDGNTGSIFPPLLTISYTEITPDDYFRNKKVSSTFSVSYEMDQTSVKRSISIAMGVLSSGALFWSLVHTWSWFRRSGKQSIDLLTLGKFLIFMGGNLSTVFFIVLFCTSLNWMVVFKMQDVVHLLLPTHNQEAFLGTYLGIAFAMKALEVIHLLVLQCSLDVFFIDWERPRNRSAANRTLSPSCKSIEENMGVSGSSKSISGRATPDKLSTEMAGISIWRTYFVANEWSEIQTMRKVNLSLQLFGTIFFLKVVGFEDLALATTLSSAAEVKGTVPYSICCRFAISSAVYLSLALLQVFFRKGIYERFVEDKLQQYVDLCSVSNVSVFVLVSKRFGYYIHGRSAHGKADVNMKEMHELLRREEEDLCGHRGLLPNTEQQTFLMALPVGVYEQFKRLLGPLTTYSQAADRMQGVGGRLSKVDIDKVVSTYHTMNKFLSGFIEHAFKDLDYIVKDKVMLETVLDIELYETNDRGYFYNDCGHSFDSVLLFGNESVLLLFDVLLFSIIDIASSDYLLSAVLTYLVGKAIQAVRLSAGRRNLVRKALVDERFLT